MKILLGSGGIRTEERRNLFFHLMKENFEGCKKVIFIPYASRDYDEYTNSVKEMFSHLEFEIIGIHELDNPLVELEKMEGIYVGGGNTFSLVQKLHEKEIIEVIRRKVLNNGIPYAGVSAGANVACPTMQTTNDMPIDLVPSFETFGIVPFQINPHYHPGGIWWKENDELREHFGETRKRRIEEFHNFNDTPVIGLYEGSFLICNENEIELQGNKAAIIIKGTEIKTISPNKKMNYDLSTR
ncbi:MAG: dipeptidase PepE [Candidatus Poseidoniales archaeon]|jgi:dipeptidase E|nr:dipeptidase PepE [Euryarchaeota archaeon]MDC0576454.1 dipeptidase PepE [Euryarchaeota archaeon]RCH75677.1 MAG: dipeptidase PepE [Candidatus Poseidoniales archaeon]|tara:strand:+ start:2290 stop:3012 length:723 start_codon:yes stop_codon:yes gene_type:complete